MTISRFALASFGAAALFLIGSLAAFGYRRSSAGGARYQWLILLTATAAMLFLGLHFANFAAVDPARGYFL